MAVSVRMDPLMEKELELAAKRKGVKIAVNPDLHHRDGFDHLAHGVTIARKGWQERGDCLNCLDTVTIGTFFRERKGRVRAITSG